jgi:hypothetical protein
MATGVFVVKAVVLGSQGPDPQPRDTVLPPAPGTDGGAIPTVPGGGVYYMAFGGDAGGKVTNAIIAPTVEAGCPSP